ncbi:unnamed protein product [Rotaria magnacalcarata]|uniref:UPAR/Ly6 domain-containing protein n=1 Tax=Rotaria magnacalcarata TaxID=392030 RepID=A0A816X7X0_9BILA|nr:unnamed protein product [Rotaria magnacalcarata]CAF2131109.1 unnamed protein product [Rotaria magnacalcarata]CAF2143573.1 unnamed protein product [Rotaria magnacalcarata]CAF3739056.1 unnamed protein product [Rotaria magnacalcarata]CAF3777843.1 unnamed protein product [Rotaria magnacalcarata]
MSSALGIFLACVVFFISQRPTSAINCYDCARGTDGCGARTFCKTGSGVFTTADSTANYCTKIAYSNNANAAVRSYATSGSCNASTTSTTAGVTLTTLCCTTDLCNDASTRTSNIIIAMTAAAVGSFLVK